MPVLTAAFASRSSEMYLRDIGFENVLAAEFGTAYHDPISDLRLTVLKSGDFRDDSGLYFTVGEFSGLFAVDCNFLNFNSLPTPVTFLASAFAGGASGFPLCFNLSDEEKRRILARNRAAIMAGVKNYLQASKPAVFMPYAGYFAEDPVRDAMVASGNVKNTPDTYRQLCEDHGAILANPLVADTYLFEGHNLVAAEQLASRLENQPNVEYYASAWERFGETTFDEVELYFRSSGFRDDLIAYFGLTDESFNVRQVYRVDFRGENADVSICGVPNVLDVHRETGARVTFAKIRTPAFVETIRELLPWEDLLIGFQARIDRAPNIYDSEFWFHFTNVHIKQKARRAISNCGGSCRRIEEVLY